jgi:hypothetical protein
MSSTPEQTLVSDYWTVVDLMVAIAMQELRANHTYLDAHPEHRDNSHAAIMARHEEWQRNRAIYAPLEEQLLAEHGWTRADFEAETEAQFRKQNP